MSRLISSIPSSELGNLNFVDLDEQEMITLAGGEALVQTGDVTVIDGGVNVDARNAARNAAQNLNVGPVSVAS